MLVVKEATLLQVQEVTIKRITILIRLETDKVVLMVELKVVRPIQELAVELQI